jgi:hypothetical protein
MVLAAERLELTHGGLQVGHDGPSRVDRGPQAADLTTARSGVQANSNERRNGPTADRSGPYGEQGLGGAARAAAGCGRPNAANRVHNRTAARPPGGRAPDLSRGARSQRPLRERPGDRGNAGR